MFCEKSDGQRYIFQLFINSQRRVSVYFYKKNYKPEGNFIEIIPNIYKIMFGQIFRFNR